MPVPVGDVAPAGSRARRAPVVVVTMKSFLQWHFVTLIGRAPAGTRQAPGSFSDHVCLVSKLSWLGRVSFGTAEAPPRPSQLCTPLGWAGETGRRAPAKGCPDHDRQNIRPTSPACTEEDFSKRFLSESVLPDQMLVIASVSLKASSALPLVDYV
ncbi:hypothetical protein Bbelb_054610 [Branchiostoma belcheri]|nr:hypothetical protein Bbelb_054610 [Branchiostoma belcheri]